MLPEADPPDRDTDEEPIEDAKIEEHEEEGDFLEDFPDETEVGIPDVHSCLNNESSMDRTLSSYILGLDHWRVSGFRDLQSI